MGVKGGGQKRCDTEAARGLLRRELYLDALKEGKDRKEARDTAGWTTYQVISYHRKNFPNWAAECDAAYASLGSKGKWVPPEETFAYRVSRYFKDRRPHGGQQVRIADELAQMRPREVKMFLIWPEAGKTATLEDYICLKLADDPGHRFRVVSEAGDLSKRIVGTVKRRLTDKENYAHFIERYGPFYEKGQERSGRPWSTEQITVLKNPGTERDRNLVASSWTSAAYGSRIDTLILDDLQSQRNYNQSEEIFKRIRGTFFNRGIELRTLIIGTRIGPGDFYERMLDAGLVTKQVILPAADIDGNPTFPDWWDKNIFHDGGPCCSGFRSCPNDGSKLTPREFMETIRHQSGEETWYASYQQNPRASERSTFAEFLERCYDHDRKYGALARTA